MQWTAVFAALAAQAAPAQLLTQSKIAPVGGGNALSTPAARHIVRMVYFQRWRSNGASDFIPDARVAVFTPSIAGVAYHRGELAGDSLGRIWVQAFKRGSTACNPAIDPRCSLCDTPGNGDNYKNDVVVSMSTDGGRTF